MTKFHQFAIWLMWLALPFTALDYWQAWDRLPARMAVHFDINWRANGWASRQAAFALAVGIVAFVLLVFTMTAYLVRQAPSAHSLSWAMLLFFAATVVFICAVNHWVVRYNLGRQAGVSSLVGEHRAKAFEGTEKVKGKQGTGFGI